MYLTSMQKKWQLYRIIVVVAEYVAQQRDPRYDCVGSLGGQLQRLHFQWVGLVYVWLMGSRLSDEEDRDVSSKIVCCGLFVDIEVR